MNWNPISTPPTREGTYLVWQASELSGPSLACYYLNPAEWDDMVFDTPDAITHWAEITPPLD